MYKRAISKLKVPSIWFLGELGFTKGPSMLKKVFSANAFLVGPTAFIAGWNFGACKKQIFAFSKCSLNTLSSFVKLYPKLSNISEEPDCEDTE